MNSKEIAGVVNELSGALISYIDSKTPDVVLLDSDVLRRIISDSLTPILSEKKRMPRVDFEEILQKCMSNCNNCIVSDTCKKTAYIHCSKVISEYLQQYISVE